MVSVVISESAHEVDHRSQHYPGRGRFLGEQMRAWGREGSPKVNHTPWQGQIPGGADESMGP